MIPAIFKDIFVPGSIPFLILALVVGTLLLYRKRDGGSIGRFLITVIVLTYWIFSTPATAVPLIRALTPDYPPVEAHDVSKGITAIVVLGAAMDIHRSRGDVYEASTREDGLRILEAARVFRLLDNPWVIVSDGFGTRRKTEAARMADELVARGVRADRIIPDEKSLNTHDHGEYVPQILRQHQIGRFVLVTSRQHMPRALRVFRKAGTDPIPSSPEIYVRVPQEPLSIWVPSRAALNASEQLCYEGGALVYYWLRGWL